MGRIAALLIDPPVGPYDPPDEVQGWIDRLEEMRTKYEGEPVALRAVERSLNYARRWLELAQEPSED